MSPDKNPMPAIPSSKKATNTYLIKARAEIKGINARQLIVKEGRVGMPSFDPKRKTGKKLRAAKKKHKKKVKHWKEQNSNILHYLQSTAIGPNHTLRDRICKFDDGVECFDFIEKALDPVKYDKITAGSEALANFNNLKLTSTSKGSWLKFRAKWEEYVRDLKDLGNPLATHSESLKESLMNKLPFDKYNWVHVTPNIFVNKDESPMSIEEALNIVQFYAVKVEQNDSSKSNNSRNIANVSSHTDPSDKPIPGTIGGHKVDELGFINRDAWMKLTKDERKKFTESRYKLINSGIKMQKAPNNDEIAVASNHSNTNSDSNSNKSNKSKSKDKRKIKKLQKQLKESKESKSESTIAESNSSNDDKPTFAEVVQGLSQVNKTRVVKFIEDKSPKKSTRTTSILKTGKRRVACTRTNTDIIIDTPVHKVGMGLDKIRQVNKFADSTGKDYVIIDGGADTGMKGSKSSLVLEHTDRTVSVTGFDDRDMHHDLPIGTTATKVVDSEGRSVILIENEQIIHTDQENSIMSVNQIRAYGADVDDCPSIYNRDNAPGRCNMIVEDKTIPFEYQQNLILLEASKPSLADLRNHPIVVITSVEPWNPQDMQSKSMRIPWTPLPEGDLNIREDEAQSIVNERIMHKVNVIFSCNQISQTDKILDEDWIDLPPLGIPTRDELVSDDDSTASDPDMPELEPRSDSDYSSDSDDESIDSLSTNSIEEEEKTEELSDFALMQTIAYLSALKCDLDKDNDDELNGEDDELNSDKESISIDDSISLTSYTSGNEMSRYVFTHCTFAQRRRSIPSIVCRSNPRKCWSLY